MTHPPNICAHCENGRDPVTAWNGYTFEFPITSDITVEICLHDGCAETWSQDFNFFPLSRKPLRGSPPKPAVN
jgi:hypothetical protein